MKAFFTTILYQPLYNLLIFATWLVPGHYVGVAIIAITILIRLALLPSSLKAARFQVKNIQLQPKINKLKSEIKDTQEQTKAIMELYKQEGHSPFGSCLPLLIQMPILIVMYTVFRNGLTTNGFSLLYNFVPRPEFINTQFLGLNLSHPDPWVLPIFAAALQFLLSWMMMPPKVTDPKLIEQQKGDPMAMMNKQMLFLPALITVFFGRTMPAALVIYWIITTVFSIGQQWYVNKEIKSPKLKAESGEDSINEEPQPPQIPESPQSEPESFEDKKKNMLANMMSKRLDKQERKAGVSVTVRKKSER